MQKIEFQEFDVVGGLVNGPAGWNGQTVETSTHDGIAGAGPGGGPRRSIVHPLSGALLPDILV